MQFITDLTRKNICEIINNNPSLILAATKLELFSCENKNINFEILLLDYYNTLMIKKNMCTLDNDDTKFLRLVNDSKVDDLRSLSFNLNFIKNAFISTVNFNSLPTLDKHQITQIAYQEKEDNDLTKRPLYKMNYIASNLSHNVQDLVNYYKEYIDINGDNLINHDSARDIIFNCLQEMLENDLESYKKVLARAIPIYYKWGKYTLSKYKKEVDITSKIFLKKIEWMKYENLLELTKYDNEFLLHIITQYLYFVSLDNDITSEVEEYSDKKLSKKMKTKLENIEENKTTRN